MASERSGLLYSFAAMPKGKEQISKGYAGRLAIRQLYKFSIVLSKCGSNTRK